VPNKAASRVPVDPSNVLPELSPGPNGLIPLVPVFLVSPSTLPSLVGTVTCDTVTRRYFPCKQSKSSEKVFVTKNTYQVHILSENLLIQTRFDDRSKFQACLDNFYRPGLIMTRTKFQRELLKMDFSDGCLKMMSIPNAGGSSLISEVLSFEFLKLFCKAELCKTEMEIGYYPQGSKITDYSVQINDEIYGVSVTRAFNFRGTQFFTVKAARHLLIKKLNGIYWSSKNVCKEHKWKKQILHCFVPDSASGEIVRAAYRQMKSEDRGNSILLVTISTNKLILK
jgi:hypothetical protein